MIENAETKVILGKYSLPSALLGPENPFPIFRDRNQDQKVKFDESFTNKEKKNIGLNTGYRVLPYRMQDNYSRNRTPNDFKSIVLENNAIKAIFLPEMGARLVSLIHKAVDGEKELLAKNPIFQPANLAIRDAWFSGGIEWNIGQVGHTFTTCSDLFAGNITGPNGEKGVRFYEFERCKRLFWQIDFFLHKSKPFLISHVKVINPYETETSMYWWTNIAVPEEEKVRVIAPAEKAIYHDIKKGGFGLAYVPYLPSLDGHDASYSLNSTFSNEFFFQIHDRKVVWEAAVDKNGRGFVEISTNPLNYRKLFCWGNHSGGQHWQEFLNGPELAYIEIQGGLAASQMHGLPMKPRQEIEWTQVFGPISVDPIKAHDKDWNIAIGEIEKYNNSYFPEKELYDLNTKLNDTSKMKPISILHNGSGWGYLEMVKFLNELTIIPESLFSFTFPKESLSDNQKIWLTLLQENTFVDKKTDDSPGEWIVDPSWGVILEKYLNQNENNWFGWCHLGVIALENFDEEKAQFCWEKSIELEPSAWVYRNLAQLMKIQYKPKKAIEFMELGLPLLPIKAENVAYYIEYFRLLLEQSEENKLIEIYQDLNNVFIHHERLRILYAQARIKNNDLDGIEEIFEINFAQIREGERILTNLWYEYWGRKIALNLSEEYNKSKHLKLAQKDYPILQRINFNVLE